MNVQEIPSSSLLIHNFPIVLSKEDVKEFLNHFGSIEASIQSTDSKKGRIVHARFQSKAAAKAALLRLHQLNILGNALKVEYTRNDSDGNVILDTDSSFSTEKNKQPEADRGTQLQEAFLKSLTSWSGAIDLNCPPPNHLRYLYPPPNFRTLKNINEAMRGNPRLYTQVLHLMNRMNLPPPFEDDYVYEATTQTEDQWFVTESTEESEYESEEEDDKVGNKTTKRPASKISGPSKNSALIKRPRVTLPPVPSVTQRTIPAVRPEEVFEKPEAVVTQKKIELKLATNIPVAETVETADVGSFGLIFPSKETSQENEKEKESTEEKDNTKEPGDRVISAEQLAQNRLPSKDLKVLPLFQTYQPGAPSCRLYIKNLSKKVESKDLHFIYRRYLQMAPPELSEMFDIRLMTEGRMKGQAFVTLPTKELAQQALQETNGYILKDKPLWVQFARSAPTTASSS